MVDLHVHSVCSDGTCTPAQLMEEAHRLRLKALALTDHDTTAGILPAFSAAKAGGPELIPGIEMSCLYQGKDIHIVGLFIDPAHPSLLSVLQVYQASRKRRNRMMAQKLTRAGFPVTAEALAAMFPGAVLTRAHFARYMLSHGWISQIDEAFQKYIGDGGPCYVEKAYIAPEESLRVIREAGGISILAHPLLYHMSENELEKMICFLKSLGLEGIEAMYSTYTDADQLYVLKLASRFGLLKSGGSDFHGANKPSIALGTGCGRLCVPDAYLESMKDYLSSRK